jgi:hypothetical protein
LSPIVEKDATIRLPARFSASSPFLPTVAKTISVSGEAPAIRRVADELDRLPDHVAVESAGQAAVRGHEDDERPLDRPFGEERMGCPVELARKRGDHLPAGARIAARGGGRSDGAAHLARGHELHRLRYLLGVADGSVAYEPR